MNLVRNENGMTIVELSRKNLEGLLAQLDDGATDAQIMRAPQGGGMLIVTARENDAHYRHRASGRSGPGQSYGEVHGETS
jgi:hypothetical protein